MQTLLKVTLIAISVGLYACASKQPAVEPQQAKSASSTAKDSASPQLARSRDGKFEGEIYGKAQPKSKFAKLVIGMNMNEVQDILGRAPDRMHTYESGKRWIPFYFGNDAQRMQVLYKSEGCLIFTNGNVFGGGGGDLITIYHDAKGDCYQP